jgi:hypothetical protein
MILILSMYDGRKTLEMPPAPGSATCRTGGVAGGFRAFFTIEPATGPL